MDVHGLYTEVLVRWMERIADGQPPLIFGDGRQTMDFVCTADIARANVLAAASRRHRGRLQRRQRHRDQPARAGRGAAAGDGLRPRRRARPRARRQRRRPPARRRRRRRAGPRLRAPRSASRRACAQPGRVVAAAARGDRRRRGTLVGAREPRSTSCSPGSGDEEAAAVAEVIASGWVAQGPRVAEFERAFAGRVGRPRTRSPSSSCTTALHLALVVAGVGPGDDVVVPSFSFIATANAPMYVGARRSSPTSTRPPATSPPRPSTRRSPPRTRAVIAVDQGGVPGRPRRHPRAVRPARHRGGRGRRLRGRARPTAAARSARAPTSPPGPSTRASCSPPARAACSPPTTRTGPPGPAGCASTR